MGSSTRGSAMSVADEIVAGQLAPGEAIEPEFGARARDRFWRFCRANPRIPVFSVVMLILLCACLLAPFISPFNPRETTTALRLAYPSWSHLMRTDQLVLDTFSQALY